MRITKTAHTSENMMGGFSFEANEPIAIIAPTTPLVSVETPQNQLYCSSWQQRKLTHNNDP